MQFEWDENKNQLNKEKHHIAFEDARYVFQDPEMIEYVDTLHSVEEERFIAIGKVKGILFVVFTERPPDTIRLISARKATAKERRLYYGTDC